MLRARQRNAAQGGTAARRGSHRREVCGRPPAGVALVLALLIGALGGGLTAAAQAQGAPAAGIHATAVQRQRNAFGFPQHGGAALYHSICQGCHMPNGKGACGAGCYPALAGDVALGVPGYAVRMVANGRKGMPGFGRMLSARQIADVVNYIRTHFGNHFPATIRPAQVKAALRGAAAAGVAQ